MTAQVEIQRPDSEHLVVLVDGKPVMEASHDEHGWAGMDAVVGTAIAIASALDVPVREIS